MFQTFQNIQLIISDLFITSLGFTRFTTTFDFNFDNDFFNQFLYINTFFPSTNNFNYIAKSIDNVVISYFSIPNIKLYYPEPFIASPTFLHDDIWFLHIVIYQYWLWFFFCFLIIFFFITFLITVRWCNVRHKPMRETRGVSRSKCGDLITATVPVSWAASIIIHESTDAIELADGFGTSELAIGVRAYQWGWEYYYPKNLDVMNKHMDKSLKLGNSLLYWSDLNNISTNNSIKLSFYNADYINPSFNSITTCNYSLLHNSISETTDDLNFGWNSLVARSSSNLITSSKTFEIQKLLTRSKSYNDNSSFNFTKLFKEFSYSDIITGKPYLRSTIFDFITPASMFYYNLNLINFKDLKMYLEKIPTNIINSPTFFVSRPPLSYLFNCYNSDWFYQIMIFKYNKNWVSNLATCQNMILEYTNLNSDLTFKFGISLKGFTEYDNSKVNNYVFGCYTKIFNYSQYVHSLLNTSTFFFSPFADIDFKHWATSELLEDSYWNNLNISLKNFSPETENYLTHKVSSRGVNAVTILLESSIKYYEIYVENFNSTRYLTNSLSALNYKSLYYHNAIRNSSTNTTMWIKYSDFFKSNHNKNILKTYNDVFVVRDLLDIAKSFNLVSFTESNFTASTNTKNILCTNFFKFPRIIFVEDLKSYIGFIESVTHISLIRNLEIYFQAFWKVLKTALDEERSNFNYRLLSQIKNKLPLITDSNISSLDSLSKKNSSTFNTNIFKSSTYNFNTHSLNNVWNYFLLPFPFITSSESDMIRYSWFDWYVARNQIVTKALDTSVFNLYGVKNYDYNFSANSSVKFINQTDNFFTKFSQARQLYLPDHIYYPFFYNKYFNLSQSKDNINFFGNNFSSLNTYYMFLKLNFYAFKNYNFNLRYLKFNHVLTNLNNKNFAYSLNFVNNQVDSITNLKSILEYRNFFYNYLHSNDYIINGENFQHVLSNTLNNPLVKYLHILTINKSKTSFQFRPTALFKSESTLCKSNSNQYIKSHTLSNPYQPMKRGINNMIRIQADKAVAMPTDTRLQILAVSKDIIHSWSIPSAGIKIDCIPGYSSHRIFIFTLSGIYWGQCMEICGRFHHWMPIVVYFLRRDLFCIWCIHFIFKNNQMNSILQSSELNNINTPLKLSYDFSNWKFEF